MRMRDNENGVFIFSKLFFSVQVRDSWCFCIYFICFSTFSTHIHTYIHTFRHFELIQYSFYLLLDDSSIFCFFLSFSLGEWHRALHKYIYSLEFFLYFTFNILIYWRDSKNTFRLLHTEKEKKNFSFIVAWQIKKNTEFSK